MVSLAVGIRVFSIVVGSALGGFLAWASWISWREGEGQAAVRLGLAWSTLFAFVLLTGLLPEPVTTIAGAAVAGLVILGIGVFLLPIPGRQVPTLGTPVPGVDERDIMFSRAELVPGSERFQEYYRRRPELRAPDEGFRREPGLLAPSAPHRHPAGFAAAEAAFWTIEKLRPFVEGGDGRRNVSSGPAPGVQDPVTVTGFLKGWARKMGCHSVGVTEVKAYHLYTHIGRGGAYGRPVDLDHPFALAFTVEMDKELVDRAPRAPTVMESAFQYLRSGVMAVQLADLMRRLGYRARAHVDGNYRVICPLVARDAGLGELGRMGLLMTPRLGPRVRIAVVTTDLPLVPDAPSPDPTTVDFCLRCQKCARACPSRAISFAPPEKDRDGVLRWKIDSEACFTLWTRLGTDCARCMAVCPYSHQDNAFHALARRGIRRNAWFRRAAVTLDDLLYGRVPPPKEDPEWMNTEPGSQVKE